MNVLPTPSLNYNTISSCPALPGASIANQARHGAGPRAIAIRLIAKQPFWSREVLSVRRVNKCPFWGSSGRERIDLLGVL